ncbi:MAG: hypothetical protein V1888_01685 [archaeon]
MRVEATTKRDKRKSYSSSRPCPNSTKNQNNKWYSHYEIGQTYEIPSLNQLFNLENILRISPKIIAKAIQKEETEETKRKNIQKWKSKVSPAQIAINDIEHTTDKTPTLFLNSKMNKVFNIMATEGHAQQGHSLYREQPYPNTTRPDIINAISQAGTPTLKRNFANGRFEGTTQEYIDNIVETLASGLFAMETAAKNGKKLEKINIRGLNGTSCFDEISPLDGAIGFRQTTSMDTPETRNSIFQKYGYPMGTGESFLANMKRLQELGIDIQDIAGIKYKGNLEILNKLPSSKRIKVLENLNVIKINNLPLEDIASGELTWQEIKRYSNSFHAKKDPKYQEKYIRHTIGRGVGDDLVIFLAGFSTPSIYIENHKESPLAVQSKIIAALLGDQIDTLSGDQDSLAGIYIDGIFNKLAQKSYFRKAYGIRDQPDGIYTLIPKNELIDITLAGANTENQYVHSSQRYFWKDEEGTCAVTEYMKHAYFCARAQNKQMKLSDIRKFKIKPEKDISNIKLTFEKIPAREVISILNERLQLISDPTRREQNLRQYFLPN